MLTGGEGMLKDLEKPIEYLKGVGEKRAECYEKLGVKTVYDLLCHYPRSYIDYTSPVPIADAPTNEPCIVKGRVVKKLPEARIRKGLSVYKVISTDDVTDLVIVIYNSEYMYKQLEVVKSITSAAGYRKPCAKRDKFSCDTFCRYGR